MVPLYRVAVMMACYNRKEKTKRCLESLSKQLEEYSERCIIDKYIFDDYSTDGTYEMIRESFPDLIIIRGDGNNYWCKSMFRLMKITVRKEYDFYLMLNDDVLFYEDAFYTMFHSYNKVKSPCGIVGTTWGKLSQKATYGGRNDQKEMVIEPEVQLQKCQWANWNCFLIDAEVIKKIGIIDGKYKHSWGDYDYSSRMIKNDIPIYVAESYVGECEENSSKGSYQDGELKRWVRVKKLFSPKGLPLGSYIRFNVKTQGIFGLLDVLYGYGSILMYILLGKTIE